MREAHSAWAKVSVPQGLDPDCCITAGWVQYHQDEASLGSSCLGKKASFFQAIFPKCLHLCGFSSISLPCSEYMLVSSIPQDKASSYVLVFLAFICQEDMQHRQQVGLQTLMLAGGKGKDSDVAFDWTSPKRGVVLFIYLTVHHLWTQSDSFHSLHPLDTSGKENDDAWNTWKWPESSSRQTIYWRHIRAVHSFNPHACTHSDRHTQTICPRRCPAVKEPAQWLRFTMIKAVRRAHDDYTTIQKKEIAIAICVQCIST